MENKKQVYETPDMSETRVELESSICSGSVDIQNPDNQFGQIEEQKINTGFDAESFNSGSWNELQN